VLLASFTTFAVFGVVFFQFGVGIAQSRETSWEGYLRTLPAGPAPRFVAQVLAALVFAAIVVALILLIAVLYDGAQMTPRSVIRLTAAFLAGAVPFGFFGIALGYWVTPKAAIPVANMLYLPLSYAGGLWIRPDDLPAPVAALSPYLPTRHFAELAWAATVDQPWSPTNWLWLAAYTGLFAALALQGFRRDEGQRFR
jgi:ABC-2 type transport system permease protein